MSITFLATGDTAPHTEPPELIFEEVRDLLTDADITFTQVERTFSNDGTFNRQSMGNHSKYDPETIAAYDDVGFDVVGVGSNHALDWGDTALLNTLRNFKNIGSECLAAGEDIDQAREPVYIERDGTTIAFLGYCSVMLPQYRATETAPGCTPIRVTSYYEPVEYQPGAPANVYTKAWEEDLEAMKDDIEKARNNADFVFMSNHWGVHFKPKHIADYQHEIARTAADAGVDLIFGHHPHLLHGVKYYDDTPCIFSLGNFAMPKRTGGPPSPLAPTGKFTFDEVYDAEFGPEKSYHHKEHFEKSLILKTEIDPGEGIDISFLPVDLIEVPGQEGGRQPVVLSSDDPRFDEVVEFVEWSSEDYDTEFSVQGDELVIGSGA